MDTSKLFVFLIAAMPIAELRVAIPFAMLNGLSPIEAYVISVFGNFFPIPFLLLFLEKILKIVEKISILKKPYNFVMIKVENRRSFIERYGYLGLAAFIAIPLPVTGAWTGSLIAVFLKMKKLKASIAILAGISFAGVLVMASTLGFLSIFPL